MSKNNERKGYRSRRARSAAAGARIMLAVAVAVLVFVVAAALGSGRLLAGHWYGLAAVTVLTTVSLVVLAHADRIERGPRLRVEVIAAEQVEPDRRPAELVQQRGPVVEGDVLPAVNRA